MFDLTEEERELLVTLTPYPKLYAPELDNSLNYLYNLQLASKHGVAWAKGAKTDIALNWLKSLKPARIHTCKNCGG